MYELKLVRKIAFAKKREFCVLLLTKKKKTKDKNVATTPNDKLWADGDGYAMALMHQHRL